MVLETKTQASVELTGQQSIDSGNVSLPTDPAAVPKEQTAENEAEPEVEVVPKSEVGLLT